MDLQSNYKSSRSQFLHISTNTIFLITGLFTSAFTQNVVINDSLMICNTFQFSGNSCISSTDTFLLKKSNDSALCRTWFIDRFFSSLNDSISGIFDFGIDKAYLKFKLNGFINARGTGYGFRGNFRISKEHRILIETAESKAVYCRKDTLNSAYQCFWSSFVPLLHESKYSICGDSLFLFFQTGSAILIDSVKITDSYLKAKKWPSKKDDSQAVDELIKGLMMDSDSIPKNNLKKR